jgi:hypothetical protein
LYVTYPKAVTPVLPILLKHKEGIPGAFWLFWCLDIVGTGVRVGLIPNDIALTLIMLEVIHWYVAGDECYAAQLN